ncbi:hypothetical protein FB567DRAFT_530593 [Paraphoma chrysanthemicola]|uniref:Uncharacterized protein n=1 Tax=Paraphoma chrysanthemicola TaxID=798071 RepID=A0A8K0VWS7_9PLEO|nr:hypothetical protein FB567DRAFT_530593 [Paraphoma chrysanthemicola]
MTYPYTLPEPYNKDNLKTYRPPYNVYRIDFPIFETKKLNQPSHGFTVDKRWYDACVRMCWRTEIIAKETCSALLDEKMKITTKGENEYKSTRSAKFPDVPSFGEVCLWWTGPRGVIDRAKSGDKESTQWLGATITIGCMIIAVYLLIFPRSILLMWSYSGFGD